MMTDNFVWYELVTSDLDAAQEFYGKVIGWTAAPFPGGAGEYRILSMAEKGVAGLMPLPEGMTAPFWLGYIGVADCDAATAKATAAGATLNRMVDMPEVGKIALISDPQGVGYAMIQGYSDRKSEAFDQSRPGHGNWHELHTTDSKAAVAFYSDQYGWAAGRVMEMGPAGLYQLFQVDGADVGGVMNAMPGFRPTWLYYFGTPNVDKAAADITANGGAILHGPAEVPGGVSIVQATDPQGAMFAVVGPRGR